MKKFYTLIMVLFCVMTASATTLYLSPNSNWTQASARFAIYYWEGESTYWVNMTAVSGETNLYSGEIPDGFTNVIFCRMNPSTTANNWDNKWDQTNDLTYDGTNNKYTVASGTWSKGGGSWSVYTPSGDDGGDDGGDDSSDDSGNTGDTGSGSTDDSDNTGISIYLDKSTASAWSKVNFYAWNADGDALLGTWPGTTITRTETYEGSTYYAYTFPAEETSINIIFNDGTNQTTDITNITSDTYFKLNGTSGTGITVTVVEGEYEGGGGFAWPDNYEGVMLQGFYWDSYENYGWSELTDMASELSKYFDLIWVPNSGRSASGTYSMGYDPVYWFTNHNGAFGTETELRTMINTYRELGTGIIEDVVVNHRSGATNWTDFPTETYNGVTYEWGPWAICSTDEVANQAGQATPTGAPDTGDDFGSSRDLDHTNAKVQAGIKAYLDFLKNDLGYCGWRYDMVKGYSGYYVGEYNKSAQALYSVGEYWDNYDAITEWIKATNYNSAAFDFPFKYAVNEALEGGDYTKLVWARYGTLNQPAGLIHMDGFQKYAVTFIDNHDTYRDDYNNMSGNVCEANAFMLCSPGTPCVFLPHWLENKSEIAKLIDIRKSVGVTNQSVVEVLESASDIYAAKVTGTKGSLIVKIGSRYSYNPPAGYTQQTYGTNYCVWTDVAITTDIESIECEETSINVTRDNITVTGADATSITIYSIGGRVVGHYSGNSANLTTLPQGIYVYSVALADGTSRHGKFAR